MAGAEAMSYIEDAAFMNSVKEKGAVMADRLTSLVPENPAPGIAVREKACSRAWMWQTAKIAGAICPRTVFDNGLLIGPCGTEGRVLKLIPPLTIPDEDLDAGLDIF